MTELLQQLRTQTDRVIEDDSDPDEVIAALEEQIALHPGEPALYRMRAELHTHLRYLYDAWLDLQQAVELDPTHRGTILALADLQHRRAGMLAESHLERLDGGDEEEGDLEEDDDLEDDEADEEEDYVEDERIAPLTATLEQEAAAMLGKLVDEHAADLPFLLALLKVVDEQLSLDNWDKYALILSAQAAHPDSIELDKIEARFLIAQCSDLPFDVENVPSGYFEDVDGGYLHALTVDKALKAIDAVLARDPDAGLAFNRGDLLAGLHRFPEAGAAYTRAAEIVEEMMQSATDDERETLAETRDDALQMAAQCQRGRAGFIEAQFQAMKAGIDQLAQLRGGTDPAQMEELASLAEQSNWEIEAVSAGPDPSMRAALQEAAKSIARTTASIVVLEPITLERLTKADLGGGWTPWFDEIEPALTAGGLAFVALFHNPAYSAALGQTHGQLWVDAAGATVLTAEQAGPGRLLRAVTELSDGTMIITAGVRGLSFWSNGDAIDTTLVEYNAPPGTLLMVHQKLVARRLARQSGLAVVPVHTLAGFEALENRMQTSKNAFRLAHGLTDTEILGLNPQFRDVFGQMVRDEVMPLMAELRARA